MLRTLLALFRPLTTIARELAIIRELWELELASRQPPIYRVTERPSKRDTEVTYSGVIDKRPVYKRGFEADEEEDDE